MYKGEINVYREQLPSLLEAAAALKIKGRPIFYSLLNNNFLTGCINCSIFCSTNWASRGAVSSRAAWSFHGPYYTFIFFYETWARISNSIKRVDNWPHLLHEGCSERDGRIQWINCWFPFAVRQSSSCRWAIRHTALFSRITGKFCVIFARLNSYCIS